MRDILLIMAVVALQYAIAIPFLIHSLNQTKGDANELPQDRPAARALAGLR